MFLPFFLALIINLSQKIQIGYQYAQLYEYTKSVFTSQGPAKGMDRVISLKGTILQLPPLKNRGIK